MKPGLTTWSEIGRIDGNVLAVITWADPSAAAAAGALLDTLEQHADRGAIHVIATPAWRSWLNDRGVPGECVLLADEAGHALELNYFLESPTVVLRAVANNYRLIVGSEAHGLYNDEVKEIFEQRVCLLLGTGLFLAHTLPNPYVYVFDLPGLLERGARNLKVEQYRQLSAALVDDFHQRWIAEGRPVVNDDADRTAVVQIMQKRLPVVIAAEEESVRVDGIDATPALAGLVAHLSSVIGMRDTRIEQMTTHFSAVLADRDQRAADTVAHFRELLAERDEHLRSTVDGFELRLVDREERLTERTQAVTIRDEIIDDLRLQFEPVHRKVIRWFKAKR